MNPPTPRDEPFTGHFSPVRLILTGIVGALGTLLGMVGSWFIGLFIDKALGYPMGRSDGFLSVGNLSVALLVVATPLSAAFGASAFHKWLGGRGSFWASLFGMLLALGGVTLLSLPGRGLVFPALVLLPLLPAVGLEMDHVRRED